MKKRSAWIVGLLIAALLCGCAGGNVKQVKTVIGESAQFDEQEIQAAMDSVIWYFKNNFSGCTLVELEYIEEKSTKEAAEWAARYEADEAIVLYSVFDVDASGGDGSLNPNSTYTGWQWVLTRSHGGNWTLQTWGY